MELMFLFCPREETLSKSLVGEAFTNKLVIYGSGVWLALIMGVGSLYFYFRVEDGLDITGVLFALSFKR
jgi:hypothetical protein